MLKIEFDSIGVGHKDYIDFAWSLSEAKYNIFERCKMKKIFILFFILLFFVAGLSAVFAVEKDEPAKKSNEYRSPVDDIAFEIIAQMYQYDCKLSLDAETIGVWPYRIPYVIEKIQYRSTHNEIVPGFFAYPKGEKAKKYPAVLLIHGNNDFWGKNEDWCMDWLELIVASGRCVLVIDNYGFGERKRNKETCYNARKNSQHEWREIVIQSVTDLRRGVDYLLTRSEVDSKRIGLLGGSRGAWFGTLVAGLEERFSAIVLTVGGSPSFLEPHDPIIRYTHSLNFASRISAPVLMANATKEEPGRRKDAEELFNAIKSPKQIVWYDSEHYLPPKKYNKEIFEWFDLYLK